VNMIINRRGDSQIARDQKRHVCKPRPPINKPNYLKELGES